MDRRAYLAAVGSAALAGCATVRDVVRSGPASFDRVALTGPDAVAVGDPFELTVEVHNGGGAPGSFSAEVRPADGERPGEALTVADVGIGRTKTAAVGPFVLAAAGTYTYELPGHGSTHTVTAEPAAVDPGEAFSLEGVELTAGGFGFEHALPVGSDDDPGLVAAGEGRVFVVVPVDVDNGGEDAVPAGRDAFSVNGDGVAGALPDGTRLGAVSAFADGPLRAGPVAAGDAAGGWLLAGLPVDEAAESVAVGWNRDGADTPPEAEWRAEEPGLPRFEVTADSVPSQGEIGSGTELVLAVTNAGEAAGTFRGVLERRAGGGWEPVTFETRDLDAGESGRMTAVVGADTLGSVEYRVRPGGFAASVEFAAATRRYGDAYTTPDGASVRPRVGSDGFSGFARSYRFDYYGNLKKATPRNGHVFAFLYATVEAVGEEPVRFPSDEAFRLLVRGERVRPTGPETVYNPTISGPVDGRFYRAGQEPHEPGESVGGWLVYQVPADAGRDELVLRYEHPRGGDPEWAAEWSTPGFSG